MKNDNDNKTDHGIKSLLFYVLSLHIAGIILVSLVVTRYVTYFDKADEMDYFALVGSTAIYLSISFIVPFLLKKRGLLFLQRLTPIKYILVVIAGLVAAFSINACIEGLVDLSNVDKLFGLSLEEKVEIDASVLIQFLGYALTPAIAEELTFRGVVFSAARTKLNFWWSALISSAVFAVFHGIALPSLVLFCISLVWCYIYEKTKNIIVTMSVHFFYNILVLLGNNTQQGKRVHQFVDEAVSSNTVAFVVTCATAILLVLSVLVIGKLTKNINSNGGI